MRLNKNAEDEDLLIDEVAAFTHDPLGHVLYVYPWGEEDTLLAEEEGPREWQREVLQHVGEQLQGGAADRGEVIRVAVASGHGVGKSALVSWLLKWAMDTCEDCRGIVTANTEGQLRTKTWPEVTKWNNLALTHDWFELTATSIKSTIDGHSENWRIDATPWSISNTVAFQGLHNKRKRIIVIFDEASGIDDEIWKVTEGALTDEYTEILWFAFGNPTEPDGAFHDCFDSMRHRWHTLSVDARKVPGTNRVLHDQWEDDYGEDSDFFKVKVKGEFPRIGNNQLFSGPDVDRCQALVAAVDVGAALLMIVDVARLGSNASVIGFRKGRDMKSIPWQIYRGLKITELAEKIAGNIEHFRPDAVIIDADGIGAGVCDILTADGYRINEFHGGAEVAGHEYYNKRAQCYGEFAKDVTKHAIVLPTLKELKADCLNIRIGFSKRHGEIQVESKEDMHARGVASPDFSDTAMMSYGVTIPRKDSDMRRQRNQRAQGALAENDYYGEN